MIQKTTLVISFLIFMTQLAICQTPTLVEDYIFGPQGSAEDRVYNFNGILTYEGTTQDGEHAILQYDNKTDEITVLATNADFEQDILNILLYMGNMLILTGEGFTTKHVYDSFQNDFSDIQKKYSSGEANIRFVRMYEEHLIIAEEKLDQNEYTTNFKVIDSENNAYIINSDLPGRTSEYSFTVAKGHIIIAPKLEMIDNKFIIAYNLETKSIVPITNILPEYQDCGFISRFVSTIESIIYYQCDKTYYYDLIADQYVDYEGEISLLSYISENHFYLNFNNDLYKIDKATGEGVIVVEQMILARGFFSDFIYFTDNNGFMDITYFDQKAEKSYTYNTNYPTGETYRFTGFGIVQSGIHFVFYDYQQDNGIIARINSESFTEIDSVYNVNIFNRPVAYDEDIYFTHQDPDVGNELFFIDYEISSTNEPNINTPITIAPNPSQNKIRIEHPNDMTPNSTSIIDINGNVIMDHIQSNEVDISNLANGIYILQSIYQNGKIGMERFVVN